LQNSGKGFLNHHCQLTARSGILLVPFLCTSNLESYRAEVRFACRYPERNSSA
jgi:hypothetical protein